MFGQSRYSHAMSTNVRQIERRLRSLEQQLELGTLLCGSPDTVVQQLRHIQSELGAGVISLNFETGGNDAAKLGNEVVELGNDALRRLSNEAKHRPVVAVTVAVGVGILLGLASGRRSAAVRAARARRSPRRRAA